MTSQVVIIANNNMAVLVTQIQGNILLWLLILKRNKVITKMVIRPLDDCTHCVDLHSLICSLGKSCTIVYGITSQPANVFSNVHHLQFCQSPTSWLKFERGTLRPPVGGLRGLCGLGRGTFDSQPMSSYWLNIETYGLPISHRF